jgi:hypothetical protein
MKAAVLPDFLRLQPHEVAREKERQERLREEFNKNAKLQPAELEMARAMVQHDDLKQASKDKTPESRARYAECLAQLGRFVDAAKYHPEKEAKQFYKAAAEAVHNGRECNCSPPLAKVGNQMQRQPKYRVLKQVHSIKLGHVANFVECSKCGNRTVIA